MGLADAVALAQHRRAEIGQAALDVELARLGRWRAGLKRVRLTLDGRISEQVERRNINAPAAVCESFEGACDPAGRVRLIDLTANLEVPIFTGFGLEASWSEARLRERAARAAFRAQSSTLALEVTRAYWAVRSTELARQTARRALTRRREMAEIIVARAEAGIAPKPDVHRARIAVLRQEAELARWDAEVTEARAEFASALQIEDELTLTEDPPIATAAPSLDEALARARQRPEVEQASSNAEAERHRVGTVRGDLWPHLSLFARADARNEAFGLPQPRLIGSYSAGLLASWLLFDSFTTYQAVRSAEAEQRKIALQAERVIHEALAEVRTAHARLQGAMARLPPLRQAQGLAEGSLDLLRRRYQTGHALLLEVLSAEEELETLEIEVIAATIAVAETRAALFAAMGATP